jgi:ABC-type transporter lipoprotein component MlaA
MKIYEVKYDSFEGHNTEIFFCNKAEAKKWIREQKKATEKVLNDPDNDGCNPFFENISDEPELCILRSTKKRDIVDFINLHTEKS